MKTKKKAGKKRKVPTITASKLKRMSFCNSSTMPQLVNQNGRLLEWVGIYWIDVGPANGTEKAIVVQG